MAILDSEKVDFLWKKIIYGVTKTAGALVKFGSNETIPSATPVLPSSVWKDGDSIPSTPAAGAFVEALTGVAALEMSGDTTAPANVAWIAAEDVGDLTSRLGDFIPPTFGSGYAAKVWIGDPTGAGPAARIFPDATNEEFVFDYVAGVLMFVGTIPAGKTATVGAGTVSVATHGVFLEAYRYIGAKGVGSDAGALGTMAEQDADDVAITGGTIDNVTLTNVTIDAGEF